MIVAYDPVAQELEVDFEDGRSPLLFAAPELQMKLYAEGGILYCRAKGEEIEVCFAPLEEEGAPLHLTPIGPERYRLTFTFESL